MFPNFRRAAIAAALLVAATTSTGSAQQNFGAGFVGLRAASQAPPGVYVGVFYWGSTSGKYVNKDGTSVDIRPGISQRLAGLLVNYVTPVKILGANWAMTLSLPLSSGHVQIDSVPSANSSVSWGYSTTVLQPLNLGWHTKRADYTFAYTLYFPTGKWSFGGSQNNGLGMWTNEFSAGATYFFNDEQTVHFALMAYYDINSAKRDTTYTQSNPFTLEGGVGINYASKSKWMGWAGVVGYGQWALVPTKFVATAGPLTTTIAGPYSESFGIGPEITTFQGALTLRYLWQLGSKSALQGNIFYAQFAMPL